MKQREVKQRDLVRHGLQVQTSLTELSTVLDWFNRSYETHLARPVLIQCQTILAEGFTNAVRHAHRHLAADTPIEIEVQLRADQIEICLWDSGPEFDLNQRIASSAGHSASADREALSGRGIQLIARLADSFTYQRIDQRNCLRVLKTCCTSV